MKLAYRIWSQGWEQDAQFERLVAGEAWQRGDDMGARKQTANDANIR